MNNIQFQIIVLLCGLLIAAIKFLLYYTTKSNAIFSDALESIVNITANFITLYSLYIAAKPRDKFHPYGHGKVEFLAAGIEGTLLFFAGILTIAKTIQDYFTQHTVDISGLPLYIILATGLANYFLGYWSSHRGKKVNSPALISGGEHLKGDGYTTFGITLSLVLIYFTKLVWLDSVIALIAGIFITYQGAKVMRRAVLDIIDTADEKILSEVIQYLQINREINWIDIHNFRILKFGSDYHIDAHLTLPYYFTNREVHIEMKKVNTLVDEHFNSAVELFIHPDPCEPFSCKFCQIQTCSVRLQPFEAAIPWTIDNVLLNEKHGNA